MLAPRGRHRLGVGDPVARRCCPAICAHRCPPPSRCVRAEEGPFCASHFPRNVIKPLSSQVPRGGDRDVEGAQRPFAVPTSSPSASRRCFLASFEDAELRLSVSWPWISYSDTRWASVALCENLVTDLFDTNGWLTDEYLENRTLMFHCILC